MCGRFSLATPPDILAAQFELPDLPDVPELGPRYNIAPTQQVSVVRQGAGHAPRELVLMRWGLVPLWAKDPSVGNRMINARIETAGTRPAFRDALERRRCIVPADGFYEWRKVAGVNQPYWLHPRAGELLAMAGVWERWKKPDGTWLLSCAILTTSPNADVAPLHDRMPVLLEREAYEPWLDVRQRSVAAAAGLVAPVPAGRLDVTPVSTRLNKPENEDPGVREPDGPGLLPL